MLEKYALIVALFTLAEGPAVAKDNIIFPMMVFTDIGHLVHVEGTLTGRGIGYPDNHVSISCYQERHECIVVNIESEGNILFPPDLPGLLDTSVWTDEKIIADEVLPCGPPSSSKLKDHWQKAASTTWIIDRSRKTAESIQTECSSGTSYHFSVENPSYWSQTKP